MELSLVCAFPFVRCRVDSDGNVYFCEHHQPIGNLSNGTFDDLWFGEVAEAIRAELVDNRIHSHCQVQNCPHLLGKTVPKRFVYNEYPTLLEIDLDPKNDGIFLKLANLLPNLQRLSIVGTHDPFHDRRLFALLDSMRFDSYPQLLVELATEGRFDRVASSEYLRRCPRSMTTILYSEKARQTIELFCQERSKAQRLRLRHVITALNIDGALDMVNHAALLGVDELEFDVDDLVDAANCGKFKRTQLDITEFCAAKGIKLIFVKPLDLGIGDDLIYITL